MNNVCGSSRRTMRLIVNAGYVISLITYAEVELYGLTTTLKWTCRFRFDDGT